MDFLDLGRKAYEAYGESRRNRTHDDREMPVWDDLGESIQRAWRAGAAAVADECRKLPHAE